MLGDGMYACVRQKNRGLNMAEAYSEVMWDGFKATFKIPFFDRMKTNTINKNQEK